jgi:hypothetical protein
VICLLLTIWWIHEQFYWCLEWRCVI